MLIDQMAINGMSSSSSSSSPFFPPNFLLQIQSTTTHDHQEDQLRRHHHQHQPPYPLSFLLSSNPQNYRSVATMVGKRSVSFSGCEEAEAAGEDDVDLSDEYCSGLAGEKKRRLSMEQVRTLEKNFEAGNKLEPERKTRLAAALGLQPRQVAIWFQNRRARWRTKQLEEDYNALKRQLEAVKSESEALQAHNKKLQAEISSLKGRETPESINLNKETEGSCSNRSENSSEINLDISRGTPPAAIESPLNPHQSIPFFPTTTIRPAPTMVQILQSSAAACPKMEHNSVVPDENFSNLLCSMDDQSGFWTWSDPHSFH